MIVKTEVAVIVATCHGSLLPNTLFIDCVINVHPLPILSIILMCKYNLFTIFQTDSE